MSIMFTKIRKNFFSYGDNAGLINWKSVDLLKKYTTRFGNIKPRKYSGLSVKHQKAVRQAIIRAREIGLLPYSK